MENVFFIIHDFRHACAALTVARAEHVFPVLITAPQTVICLGTSAVVAMIDDACLEANTPENGCSVFFDAQNHVGAALALVQSGKTVYSLAPEEVLCRLDAIAQQTGGAVVRVLPENALDLGNHFHFDSACRNHILKQKEKK